MIRRASARASLLPLPPFFFPLPLPPAPCCCSRKYPPAASRVRKTTVEISFPTKDTSRIAPTAATPPLATGRGTESGTSEAAASMAAVAAERAVEIRALLLLSLSSPLEARQRTTVDLVIRLLLHVLLGDAFRWRGGRGDSLLRKKKQKDRRGRRKKVEPNATKTTSRRPESPRSSMISSTQSRGAHLVERAARAPDLESAPERRTEAFILKILFEDYFGLRAGRID